MSGICITSLDSSEKSLHIFTSTGLNAYDISFATEIMGGVHLTAAGVGTGNYNYICPLYAAARNALSLFQQNKYDAFSIKNPIATKIEFSKENIIAFGVPEWYGNNMMTLDLIKSDADFFGIRTGRITSDECALTENNIVWLCGPDNTDHATRIGKRAYQKRRDLFGRLYETAAAINPVQMSNPIFPGENGMNYIKRGY